MTSIARRWLSSLVLGLLFGLGLVISGMTQPEKVFGFLDIAGDWDPSLAFVMGGAVITFALVFRLAHRRPKPLIDGEFPKLPKKLDAQLVGGAVLFGAGWGLAGICPGPALVDLGAGITDVAIFVVAMTAGIALHNILGSRVSGADAPAESGATAPASAPKAVSAAPSFSR